MPDVSLDLDIRAPVERVWQAVVDIERYPDSMANVRWVRIVEWESPGSRITEWSIVLKGAILEWRDREVVDHEARVVSFDQLSGDLARFEGSWRVVERDPALTRVTLAMSFEIGVPLLAEMLNPVAQRALHENCTEMLRGVEAESLAG